MVERCTGIVEVMGSNPVRAWTFFRPHFTPTQVVIITAKIASRYDGLFLSNEHSELCFYRIIFIHKLSPFNQNKLKKNIRTAKKGTAKRAQEARYSRTQIITLKAMTRSTFWISVTLFFHKLWNTLLHIIRSWLFTHQALFYCYFHRTVP